jgi:hypothetical protein
MDIYMSRSLMATTMYAADYNEENLGNVVEAIARTVEETWDLGRDSWSDPLPSIPVETKRWLQLLSPQRLTFRDYHDSVKYWLSDSLHFSYSPMSYIDLHLSAQREMDGKMTLNLFLPDDALCETKGQRELERMTRQLYESRRQRGDKRLDLRPYEDEPNENDPGWRHWDEKWDLLQDGMNQPFWPVNQPILMRILNKLWTVLPVRKVIIDKELAPADSPELGRLKESGVEVEFEASSY